MILPSAIRLPLLQLSEAGRLMLLFALLAIPALAVPWFVSGPPVRSVSYAYGFSNAALWALVLLVVVAPVVLIARSSARGILPRASHVGSPEVSPAAVERRKSWALATGVVFALLLLACAYDLSGAMQAEYFLSRVALLKAGKVPYVDFEFAYGPLLLQAPLGLQLLGLPPSLGFVLVVLAESAIGYFALRSILNRLFEPQVARLVLFSIVLATTPGLLMAGENYTFFRFAVAPAASCMLVQRLGSSRGMAGPLLIGPAFVFAWLISPEIAIATACALTGTLVLLSSTKVRTGTASLVSVVACAAATPALAPSYRSLLEFGGGGHHFPAFPGPHILLALLTIFLATVQVASRPIRAQPIDLFIYLFSLALIPGMLGTCDAVHVVFYGFGFTALAAKFCVQHRVRGFDLENFLRAYIAIFLAAWFASHLYFTASPLAVVLSRSALGAAEALEPVAGPYSQDFHRFAASFHEADSWKPPALTSPDHDVRLIPPRSDTPGIAGASLYFVGLENAFSPGAYEALGKAVAGKHVLLADGMLTALCAPVNTDVLAYLFLFPTGIFPKKHDGNEVARRFCRQLQEAPTVAKHDRFVELAIPE